MKERELETAIQNTFQLESHRNSVRQWLKKGKKPLEKLQEFYSLLIYYGFDLQQETDSEEYPFVHPLSPAWAAYSYPELGSQSLCDLEREIRGDLWHITSYVHPPPKNGLNSYALEEIFYRKNHKKVVRKWLKYLPPKQSETIAGTFMRLLTHYSFDLWRCPSSKYPFVHLQIEKFAYSFPNLGTMSHEQLEIQIRIKLAATRPPMSAAQFELPLPFFPLKHIIGDGIPISMRNASQEFLKGNNIHVKGSMSEHFKSDIDLRGKKREYEPVRRRKECFYLPEMPKYYYFFQKKRKIWVSMMSVYSSDIAPIVQCILVKGETAAIFCGTHGAFDGSAADSVTENSERRNELIDTAHDGFKYMNMVYSSDDPAIRVFDVATLNSDLTKKMYLDLNFQNIILAWCNSENNITMMEAFEFL